MLSNSFGNILDSLSFGTQVSDNSVGRCPNGTGAFTVFTSPTFNASNCIVGVEEVSSSNSSFKVYPNPGKGNFTIRLKSMLALDNKVHIEISNLAGERVYS